MKPTKTRLYGIIQTGLIDKIINKRKEKMFSEIGLNPNLIDYVHELSISELETLSEYALYLIEMKERIYGDSADYELDDELGEVGELVWNESF